MRSSRPFKPPARSSERSSRSFDRAFRGDTIARVRPPRGASMGRYDAWGPLAARYETTRPRRILTLDGGGIRGILTLHVLAEIEKQLAATSAHPEAFRLCDFFDYIAGTSTGAII